VFWLPLAATWLMMSFEGPFLAALIARLAEPKYNLAAYGVAFSFALIIEAPIIMIMSASTKLVKDAQSFIKLRKFTYGLNWLITLIMLIILIPPIFYFLTEDLIGLPSKVSNLTHLATIILIPWPGAIGYRRFYQGILIRNDLTRRVAYGTVIRITTMALTALLLYLFTDAAGVVVGAASISAAVFLEAVASRIMADGIIKKIEKQEGDDKDVLTYKAIYNFYYPLALTSIIGLGVQPVVTFFMGQSRMAIESLAVLPVVISFVFIFRALGLSYQEVVIALMGDDKKDFKILRNFAFSLGAVLTIVLALVAFTPLSDIWFRVVSGLTDNLAEFARVPLMIMTILPLLTVLISLQRSALVSNKTTHPITIGTAIEFIAIVLVLFISIKYAGLVGAVAATLSFVIGRLAANIYLTQPVIKAIK
jgi:O-antigen/teichoic acid export membrane protein